MQDQDAVVNVLTKSLRILINVTHVAYVDSHVVDRLIRYNSRVFFERQHSTGIKAHVHKTRYTAIYDVGGCRRTPAPFPRPTLGLTSLTRGIPVRGPVSLLDRPAVARSDGMVRGGPDPAHSMQAARPSSPQRIPTFSREISARRRRPKGPGEPPDPRLVVHIAGEDRSLHQIKPVIAIGRK